MDIHLQDLGPKWQIALLQRRLSFTGQAAPQPQEKQPDHPPVGPLGRWWTGGLGLSPAATEATLAALKRRGSAVYVSALALGILVVTAGAAAYFGQESFHTEAVAAAVGLSTAGLMLAYPKFEVSCIRQPVTATEILALRGATKDPLELSYIGLVQEIQQQTLMSEAVPQLRGAVRALGHALCQLPAGRIIANVEALREASAQRLAEADMETDAVVAASLLRQAAALRRSADTAEKSAILVRRTTVLRDELSAQIESLRLGLAGYETTSGDVSGLSDLAEAVHTVATQAASLADARAELDAALQGPSSVALPPPPMPQVLRAGGN